MLHLANHMLLSFLDVAIVIIIACCETFSPLPTLAGSLVVCDTVSYVIVPLLSTFTSFEAQLLSLHTRAAAPEI